MRNARQNPIHPLVTAIPILLVRTACTVEKPAGRVQTVTDVLQPASAQVTDVVLGQARPPEECLEGHEHE